MSGRGRLALCATAATLLTMCSLLPLTTPMGWFGGTALLIGVQAGVGAAARRIPLARPVTVLAQAAVTLLLLTAAFASRQAVLGFLPGPQAVDRLVRLLSQGVQDVGQYAIPAPVTPGIRLLLVGGMALVALTVDALAVTYDRAAPAGLPLLALYSVASGLGTGAGRWLWFLLAAFGYLLLLLAEGRDRLSRWGRVFSGTPRRTGFAPPPGQVTARPVAAVRSGRRIGVMTLGIALLAPALLPSMGDGLLGPVGSGSGLGRGGGTITAVNPLVSLRNSLNQSDDREVLRYRTTSNDPADMYLRIVTLDQFDGTSWKASERKVVDLPENLPTPQGLVPGVHTSRVATAFTSAPGYAQTYLPMPYPATGVEINGNWRYEPAGRTLVGDRGETTSGIRYQVESLEVNPTARQLTSAPPAPAALVHEYTRVPATLPPVVADTARKVTQGSASAYEQAVKLQDWFTSTGDFTYDTRVAEGSGPQAIARFLHDRRGFCVHFAFSMAAMARTLGIPARVDVGFVPGTEQSDNSWAVGLKEAHAWPELYFQGVGWTRFEPTPSRGSAPDYTRTATGPGGDNDLPAPHLGGGAQPTGAPSDSASCAPELRRSGDCSPDSGVSVGGPSDGGGSGGGLVAGASLLALLLALASLPALWRARMRAVRLGAAGADGPDAEGRTLAAWRELRDTAWDYGIPPDDSETPRRACDRLIGTAGLTGAPADAVRRVGGAVEQVLYAPRPTAVPGVPDDVRMVRRALDERADRWSRLRARYAPRSAARVARRAREGWSAARARGRRTVDRLTSAVLAVVRPGS